MNQSIASKLMEGLNRVKHKQGFYLKINPSNHLITYVTFDLIQFHFDRYCLSEGYRQSYKNAGIQNENGCSWAGDAWVCLCDTDLCNRSQTIGIKPIIAIITTGMAIFFGKVF